MAVVTATGLRKELSGDPLFDDVSFKVERRDRVSLSGANGAGKTTLLRILNGETELHGGKLSVARGTRIALHDQRPPAESHASLRDYVLSGAADLSAAEQELRRLERAMAAGDHEAATLRRYAESQARLEHAGGYAWRERLDSVTRNLGFSSADLERPLATFSGGELTRASLARALGGDPDLLLLDEPTNHLDVANLEWLERELQSIDAAVILVAHDRWFLEAVTTAVLELEAGRSTYFAGPWHNWRREKAARLSAAGTAAKRYDVDIARLERFVERFRYKKSLAKRAQAKLTQIGRLEQERAQVKGEISLLTRRAKSLGFEFLQPKRSGRTVVEVTDAALAAGDKALLSGVSFAVERGEHVALVGPNGSGKTTLLETLLGRREPAVRARRRACLLLAARDRARRDPVRPRLHAERNGAPSSGSPESAGPLPLQRLGDARAVGVRALRGRAAPACPGAGRRLGREPAAPRRADEPSRSREPGGPRSRARRVSGHGLARLARSSAARRHRRPHPGDRGRDDSLLRGRLGGVRREARRPRGGRPARAGEAEEVQAPSAEGNGPDRARAPRSRDRRPGSRDRGARGPTGRRLGKRRRRVRASPRPRRAAGVAQPLGAAVRALSGLGLAERRDDGLGDDLERSARDLACLPQPGERLLLGQGLLCHEQALGPLDHLAGLERLRQGVGLLSQRGELIVAGVCGLDRREQILLAERLHEVPEDACFDSPRNQLVLAVGRQHHDRNRALVKDPPGGLDPVQSRHLHVEHRHVGLHRACELDRLFAVSGLGADLVPGPLEERLQVEADDRLVLRDQDSHEAECRS